MYLFVNQRRERLDLEALCDTYKAQLEDASSARRVLSRAVRDHNTEKRIINALEKDWWLVPTSFRPYETEEIECISLLRKINPRHYQARLVDARKRKQPFPDPILPLQEPEVGNEATLVDWSVHPDSYNEEGCLVDSADPVTKNVKESPEREEQIQQYSKTSSTALPEIK